MSSNAVSTWTLDEVRRVYRQPLLPLIEQAHDLHRQHFPEPEVQLCQLLSIKTGGCPEDCGYCSQSARHGSEIEAGRLMETDAVLDQARAAKDGGATRFCMGAAWRQAKDGPEFDRVLAMVRGVADLGLEVCCTLGMLTPAQAQRLADAGLTAYNHNLDTSPEFYGEIIHTRTYADRLKTLENVRDAGITVCCGGILGLGEGEEDRIRLLHVLATMKTPPESVPINGLVAVPGTPLEGRPPVPAFDFVRAIATARILMPRSKVRLSAGRLSLSPEAQALCFYSGANSIFIGDKLLTTPNPDADGDRALLRTLGLLPEPAYSAPDVRERHAHNCARLAPAPAAAPADDEPLEAALERQLQDLARQSRLRRLTAAGGIDFCSNDYLGLTRHPAVRTAVERALRDGLALGSTGSRLVRGNHPAYEALEEQFAAFRGVEAALFFSSGYAAACAVLPALIGRDDIVFSDALNHASLIDGLRLSGAERVVTPHLDLVALEDAIAMHPARAGQRRFLVVESIYSMEGDRAPLRALVDLCQRHRIELLVDEAHATGVFGPGGEGCLVEEGLAKAALLSFHPCGKALGGSGALVASSRVVCDFLVNRARGFIFSTAAPPGLAVQLAAAIEVVENEPERRQRLFENVKKLRAKLRARAILPDEELLPLLKTGCSAARSAPSAREPRSPIIPILLGDDARALAVAEALAAKGFDLRAIRPPTVPAGSARLRLTVSSEHTPEQIEGLVAALTEAMGR